MLDILTDISKPTDSKMKLYNQELTRKRYNTVRTQVRSNPTTTAIPSNDGDHIVNQLPLVDRPNARAILNTFKQNQTILNWNDRGEVIVDERVIPGSDISRIFQYFTNNLPIGKHKDLPLGTGEVYDALMSLDVPKEWFKKRPRTKRSSKKSQSSDYVWSSYAKEY